jgi:hypothetical protein
MSRHEHITHIGNLANRWQLTREEAIRRIDAKSDAFYTVDQYSNRKVYIGVVREPGKSPYVRSHADNKWNDNLLALNECNGACALIA